MTNYPAMDARHHRAAPWNETPRTVPACVECDRIINLRNVEPAPCYWDGDDAAYCERHGRLTGDAFDRIEQ